MGGVPTIPSRGSLLKRVLINLVPAALPEPNNNHPPSLARLATNDGETPWPRLLLWRESHPSIRGPSLERSFGLTLRMLIECMACWLYGNIQQTTSMANTRAAAIGLLNGNHLSKSSEPRHGLTESLMGKRRLRRFVCKLAQMVKLLCSSAPHTIRHRPPSRLVFKATLPASDGRCNYIT